MNGQVSLLFIWLCKTWLLICAPLRKASSNNHRRDRRSLPVTRRYAFRGLARPACLATAPRPSSHFGPDDEVKERLQRQALQRLSGLDRRFRFSFSSVVPTCGVSLSSFIPLVERHPLQSTGSKINSIY